MAKIVIVGAGLSGLAAAVTVVERGHEVLVLEASDGVGGQVRTDPVDGFLLDRGFQTLLTAYPTAQSMLDYDALDLRRFQPGALVQLDADRVLIGDPLRRPADLRDTVFAPIGSPLDKARFVLWRKKLLAGPVDAVWHNGESTTNARLGDLKFSTDFVDRFLRPLLVGLTLDPKLEVSSRVAEFGLRMLAEGYQAVPARGMGEIATQLALRLPDETIRLHAPVSVVGSDYAELADGERIDADAIIVAADMDSAADLVDTPRLGWNSTTTWWYAADEAPYAEPLLVLNGKGDGPVNNVAVLSNVSPHYAPAGKHLIAASSAGGDGSTTAADVEKRLGTWFGNNVSNWELLRVDRIEHGLVRHLPGEAVPAKARLESGVFVAGAHRQSPSLDGALQSGSGAARSALSDLSSP